MIPMLYVRLDANNSDSVMWYVIPASGFMTRVPNSDGCACPLFDLQQYKLVERSFLIGAVSAVLTPLELHSCTKPKAFDCHVIKS